MEQVMLGLTGRTVSRLGFGGATAGLKNYLADFDPDRSSDHDALLAALGRAVELGIGYFDTAAGYGDGASERIFGEGLAAVPPADIFLATKFGHGHWRPGEVRRSLERSLANLRRDYVDLLQIHGTQYAPEQVQTILSGGLLDELEALRDEGLVRHLGFSIESEGEAMTRLLDSGRFAVVHLLYNLMFQHPYDPGWRSGSLFRAEQLGLGVVTMRSTTSGMFLKWVRMVNPDNAFDYRPALLQFNLSCPLVDVALVGMRTIDEVEANVRTCADTAGRIDFAELYRRYV